MSELLRPLPREPWQVTVRFRDLWLVYQLAYAGLLAVFVGAGSDLRWLHVLPFVIGPPVIACVSFICLIIVALIGKYAFDPIGRFFKRAT